MQNDKLYVSITKLKPDGRRNLNKLEYQNIQIICQTFVISDKQVVYILYAYENVTAMQY